MRLLRRLAPGSGWPRLLISLALFFVQGTVALTPLTEARQGIGAAAHVEASNRGHHYAHNDANCAFCVARSIHATTAPAPTPPAIREESDARVVTRGMVAPTRIASAFRLSRAPPPSLL